MQAIRPPFNSLQSEPLSPPALLEPSFEYFVSYPEHQNICRQTGVHTGGTNKRGGVKQKARDAAKHIPSTHHSEHRIQDGKAWKNQVVHHLPEGLNPFEYMHSKHSSEELVANVLKKFNLEQLIQVPIDGFWCLPVGDLVGMLWPRVKSPNRVLENWGPKYFAFRVPNTFTKALTNRVLNFVKFTLEGNGVSHQGIKAWIVNDNSRSEYNAHHVGVIQHYGKDDVGLHGLRLSKDTIRQGKVELDSLHIFFTLIQEKVVPIILCLLCQIDPTVYQFQQA
jgi:hypothetical protein